MIRERLEHNLNNHTSEKELKDAVDMFNCYNVPDNGEKKKAQEKLTQYWEIKKGINTYLYFILTTTTLKETLINPWFSSEN